MHIFLYEWATGGGLVEESGPLPATLVREGGAMIGAVAADLTKSGCRVSALRDPRVMQFALHDCEIVDADSTFTHNEEFERLASVADATILIAPEFDGILLKAANRVVANGGRLASPAPDFIRIAANKQRAAEMLSAAGIPTPLGIALEPDEALPSDFTYPAVLKPIDGAGSQDTYVVSGPHDAPPAYAWQRRLERFVPGLAVSSAALCGPNGRVTLMPCKQRLTDDGRLRYLGGELPLAPGLAERARHLAERAIAVMPAAVGYVGVDLVLGGDPHGHDDVVIEVNPRFTTSYVGLRAAAQSNLAEAMLKVVGGEQPHVAFSDRAIEFDAAGNVSFMR
jgi:predicted ATP-grasp superfamily ATP-dependent carboligase